MTSADHATYGTRPWEAAVGEARRRVKRLLARIPDRGPPRGVTVLIYHRVGGGSCEELDLPTDEFARQLEVLGHHEVVPLDDALDALARGDDRSRVVLSFDDGFSDVHSAAWPLLSAASLPFTLYLATGYIGAPMTWEGSTARQVGTGMTWEQVRELVRSGACTLGNHTRDHVRPERLTVEQLDGCDQEIIAATGVRPRHFAYPWGVPVPSLEPALRSRFRSAATGEVGRNRPLGDPLRLRRVPVRRTDPIDFFRSKLSGSLRAEHAYAATTRVAKRVVASGPGRGR